MNGIAHCIDQIMRPSFYPDLGQGRPRGVTIKAERKKWNPGKATRHNLQNKVPMKLGPKKGKYSREEWVHMERMRVIVARIELAGQPLALRSISRVDHKTREMWEAALSQLVRSGAITQHGQYYALPGMECQPIGAEKTKMVIEYLKTLTGEFTRIALINHFAGKAGKHTIDRAIGHAIDEGIIERISLGNQPSRYKRT